MGFRGLTINTVESESPHVYAENDAAIYQAILGDGDMLLNYGSNFQVDVMSYNTVHVNSGLLSVQGRIGIIEIDDNQELILENGTSGVTRHDLIIAEFSTSGNHGIDTFTLKVLKGTSSGSRPSVRAEDLNNGGKVRQFAIADVTMNGLSISDVSILPKVATNMSDLLYALNDRISYGTEEPSGGKDGDIYIMY